MTLVQHNKRVKAFGAALLTAAACFSACSSDGDNTQGEAVQPATDANGMPMPGNLNKVVATMGAAGTAAKAAAGVGATSGAGRSAAGTTGATQAGAAGSAGGKAATGDVMTTGAAAGIGGASGMGAAGAAGAAAGSGAAGAAGGGAGAGATTTMMSGDDPCGPDAMPVMGNTTTTGNGSVLMFTSGNVEVLSTTMTMLVPKKPNGDSTLFLWPGLQPSSQGGISGFGVLQPVLTWGGSCNGNRPNWWISGQYVYFTGGFGGAECETGDLMDVGIGDKLDIEFILKGTVWTQNVTNQTNIRRSLSTAI